MKKGALVGVSFEAASEVTDLGFAELQRRLAGQKIDQFKELSVQIIKQKQKTEEQAYVGGIGF